MTSKPVQKAMKTRYLTGVGVADSNMLSPFFPSIMMGMSSGINQAGINLESLFDREGPALNYLSKNKFLFSVPQLLSFTQAYQAQSLDYRIAFTIGKTLNFSALGLLGQLIVTSASLAQAFANNEKYWTLTNPSFYFGLEQIDATMCTFSFNEIDRVAPEYQPVMSEMFFAALLAILRSMVREEINPIKADFIFKKPDYADIYLDEFCHNITFNSSKNCLTLDSNLLNYVPVASSPTLHKIFLARAEALLADKKKHPSVTGKVICLLEEHIANHDFGISDIANSLGMEVRTLQRKLRDENTSYGAITDAIRFDHAKNLLRNTEDTIGEISDQLGFADTSNFNRAFRRWSGQAANEYRLKYTRLP